MDSKQLTLMDYYDIQSEKAEVIDISVQETYPECDFAQLFNSNNFEEIHNQHSMTILGNSLEECKPATKYLDLYLKMFWWLEKNKDISKLELMNRLKDILYGSVCNEYRAKMTNVTQKELYSRQLPIDTKGYY